LHKFSNNAELCWKDKENPVTEVDYLIQQYIVNTIQSKYGDNTISIVAEEDLTYKLCPQFKKSIELKLFELKEVERTLELPKIV
jgi:3'-phosphoadenosine 5'-phosphosulfate (PAPS) 3'-phosphatase